MTEIKMITITHKAGASKYRLPRRLGCGDGRRGAAKYSPSPARETFAEVVGLRLERRMEFFRAPD